MKNINLKLKEGFTLIELLVTIAIIGILAGFILTRYPVTIKQGNDARVINDLSQFRVETGIIFQADKNFSNLNCTVGSNSCSCTNVTLNTLCTDARKNSDQDFIYQRNQDNLGFCLVAHLAGDNSYFCVDGNLYAKKYITTPATCTAGCVAGNSCRCE
ncbi:MAG: type II secretion system protein [Candidatus Gribaldobacteria bacterium]|nr:type II secretion system protein [Candidatus Gribaldobacteria bacterium]